MLQTTNSLGDALCGAAAGMIGTAAMTPLMRPGLTRHLPASMRLDEFPPRRVVQALERQLPRDVPSEANERRATWLAHAGYGAALGALFALIRRQVPDARAALLGAAYGVTVWAANYAGAVPALGVRESTIAGRPGKIPVPLAAHVVFGLATALSHDRLRQ